MSAPSRRDQFAMLDVEVARLQQGASHLSWSLERARPIVQRDAFSVEDLERLESLGSRFAAWRICSRSE